mgnify:CR=1 FL=1
MTDQPQPLLPFTAFDHQALQQAQATNLVWCEEWGRGLSTVAGVNIGQALTFDLITLLNRAEIETILGPTPDFVAIEARARRQVDVKIPELLTEAEVKQMVEAEREKAELQLASRGILDEGQGEHRSHEGQGGHRSQGGKPGRRRRLRKPKSV